MEAAALRHDDEVSRPRQLPPTPGYAVVALPRPQLLPPCDAMVMLPHASIPCDAGLELAGLLETLCLLGQFSLEIGPRGHA
jgi:hypothetical protein